MTTPSHHSPWKTGTPYQSAWSNSWEEAVTPNPGWFLQGGSSLGAVWNGGGKMVHLNVLDGPSHRAEGDVVVQVNWKWLFIDTGLFLSRRLDFTQPWLSLMLSTWYMGEPSQGRDLEIPWFSQLHNHQWELERGERHYKEWPQGWPIRRRRLE